MTLKGQRNHYNVKLRGYGVSISLKNNHYTQAHALMSLVDKEQSRLFLLSISKLHQLGLKLVTNMEDKFVITMAFNNRLNRLEKFT